MRNLKKYFPFFKENPSICFLNNAATTQKPACMIAARKIFFKKNKNLSEQQLLEKLISKIHRCKLILASKFKCLPEEVIFCSQGSTKAFNLISSLLKKKVNPERNLVLSSPVEHHANLVPWLNYFKKIKFLSFNTNSGSIEIPNSKDLAQAGIVSVSSYSNVLGKIWENKNLKKLINKAHQEKTLVMLDASQAPTEAFDFSSADLILFSAHKFYGPTNLGVIIARKNAQTCLGLSQSTTPLPRMEVLEFLESLKFLKKNKWLKRENTGSLETEIYDFLKTFPEVKLLTKKPDSKIISFFVENCHSHDLADLLGQENIIARAGNHCAKPIHDALGYSNSLRISLGCYNTKKDVSLFKKAFVKVLNFLKQGAQVEL